MTSVWAVVRYFVDQNQAEDGDEPLSNLKLQKLLYYAQGFHLAFFDGPLFVDPIVAGLGPLVLDVYRQYNSDLPLSVPPAEAGDLTDLEQELLLEVWQVYGQLAAWKLSGMVRDEPPYRETSVGGVITHERLWDYFLTQTIRKTKPWRIKRSH